MPALDYTLAVLFRELAMSSNSTQGIDAWVTRLNRAELPVLGNVMREINRLTKDSDTSVNQLAQVIIKDAGLTAKVLRLANSIHFNPYAEQEVTTISRAVQKLGFQGIKALSLSVMLIDSLLKRGARERMLQWLGRAFHSAVQAEQLIAARNPAMKEDVFIAALLYRLGELAFWSCRGEQMSELEAGLGDASGDETIEREVLGTTLQEITRQLASVWQMGPTLLEAVGDASSDSPAVQAVRLGDAISAAAEQGWDSEALEAVIDRVAEFSGSSRDEVRQSLLKGAEEAASVAISYGANKVCNYIPTRADAPAQKRRAGSVNPELQLKLLRELGSMINDRVDVNTLFQMVVEGVHRGVGLERVGLCLLDPRDRVLKGKYALGEGAEVWRDQLRFPTASENLVAHCLQTRRLIWMRPTTAGTLRHLIDRDTSALITPTNCLLAPLFAGDRQVGVLLADRGPDGELVDQDQHESFSHFAQQANMGLAMLATQVKRG